MNEDELLLGAIAQEPTPEDYAAEAAAAKAQADLQKADQELNQPEASTDTQPSEEVATEQGEVEPFDPSKDFSYYEALGMSRKEWTRAQMDGGISADMENFATNPRDSAEYALAAPAGVLDTVIGGYNMLTPGFDIPQLPKFQQEGAQLTRDLSSIVIPGMGFAGGLRATGGLLAARTGRVGAFARDPFIAWAGTNLANLGGGATADLFAPVQGDVEGQTLLGQAKAMFPRWMGWLPEQLEVLDGDGPDDARAKNITEGTMFGGVGSLIEGLGKLAKGLKGLDTFTEYRPRSETGVEYFSKAENQPSNPLTVEDAVNETSFRVEGERAELGAYNEYKAAARGELTEESVIFGRDDILFSPGENGLRSTDQMGIVGAKVDVTRIDNNIDTIYGRIRNPMSEASLKFSLEETGAIPRVMYELGDAIRKAGDFDYVTTTGKYIDNSKILNSVDRLTAEMLDMNPKQLGSVLKGFTQLREGIPVLTGDAAGAVPRAINQTLEQLGDINMLRAYALTETSMAGQVSDFAMQLRLNEGTEGMMRAQEQMLDRLEFLMDLRGTTDYAKNKMKTAANLKEKLLAGKYTPTSEKYAQSIVQSMTGQYDEALEAVELVQADTRRMMQSLREISAERPLYLRPLATAYELTDGDVRSVSALNNWLKNSAGVLKKAFVDGQPEIPSMIMDSAWAQAFNSALNGVKTPIKAGVSNLATWVLKPSTHVIGAFLQGNKTEMTRAFYAYGNAMETIGNANQYMKQMWTRSGMDPMALRGRDELIPSKTDEKMNLFKQVAEAATAEGNDGPQILYDIMKNQKDLAEHPWLRIGNRTMGAQDVQLQAVNGQMIARLRAYDKITEGGKEFNKTNADELAQRLYQDMFDKNGVLSDEQVLRQTKEQTFSADNALSTAFQSLTRYLPGLKPFLMFTRTPVNAIKYGGSFQPVGVFIDKTKKFDLPFEQQPVDKITRLLQEEGVDLTKMDARAEYTRLRNEYKGRAAIGVSFVMAGVYGYLSGNITGRAGLYNKEKQRARVKDQSWKPMRAFGIDYSQIPAVSDWVGLTVDVLDNAMSLESYDVEETLRALGHIIGANISDRTMLTNMEQFQDVVQGNPAAIQRWASNMVVTSQFKVAGALGTMNSVMAPQLKAVENNFYSLLANRLPGKPGLPDQNDWIDGGVVNDIGNPLHRIYNALSPFPYHEKPSEVKEYLSDVEWSGTVGLSSRSDGAPYTKTEAEQIKKLIGDDGFFRKQVKRIMKQTPASSVREQFYEAKGAGLSPNVSDIDRVHSQLDMALSMAKARAEGQLPELMIKKREEAAMAKATKGYVKRGDIEGGQRFLNQMQSISK